MARVLADSVDVPTAGTRVQISATPEVVLVITFKARAGNSGKVYIGDSTVAAAVGFELAGGTEIMLNPSLVAARDTSVLLSDFYVDAATNGDDVDFIALVK
tara:strand:- start:818 stop:1120 length:303 start_codon:yes stop_codon:yes gene_type:complete